MLIAHCRWGTNCLALANALTRIGTDYIVLEGQSSTSIHTKATNLMPGTLEQLDVFGLSDRMVATGRAMTRYNVYMYGSNVGPRTMHHEDCPYPNVLFLGQDLIEKNLKESLPDAGANIRFSHRLTCLTQDSEGVTATVETPNGEKQMRVRYVVGCDGPRSVVRSFSKCQFEPVKTGKYVWQADAKLTWKGLRTIYWEGSDARFSTSSGRSWQRHLASSALLITIARYHGI